MNEKVDSSIMEDLIRDLESCGLLNVRQCKTEVKMIEADHNEKDKLVSKNVIISLTLNEFNEKTQNEKTYHDFEDKNISPLFFNLEGDLSWNLYIVFVLSEDDFSKCEPHRKSLVERGMRYGRKYIIRRSEIINFFPIANLKGTDKKIHKVHPLRNWLEILEPEGLAFTLDTFSRRNVESYIAREYVEDTIDKYTVVLDEQESEYKKTPMTLKSIQFGDKFRPHCWPQNQSIEFSKVNLLEGANGAGKTSILEAIELAFTGELLRNKLSSSQVSEEWDGRIEILEDEIKELVGNPSSLIQRDREKKYYQFTARERTRRRLLNQFYHRYNYFTSEDIFRHCYTNERHDFKNEFGRIIFGDELALYEENMKRYKDEFDLVSKRYETEMGLLRNELSDLEKKIKDEDELINSKITVKLPVIKEMVTKVWGYYPLYEEGCSRKELLRWIEGLYTHLYKVENISRPLKDVAVEGGGNVVQLQEIDRKTRLHQEELEKLHKELLDKEVQLPNLSELESTLIEMQRKVTEIKSHEDELIQKLEYVRSKNIIFDDEHKRNRRKALNEGILSHQKNILESRHLKQKWFHITKYEFEYEDESRAKKRLKSLNKQKQKIHSKLEHVISEIQAIEVKQDAYQNMISKLKALGQTFTHEHPNESICPLCKHDHGSAQILQAQINKDLVQDQDRLKLLRVEEVALKSNSSILDEKITYITEQIKALKETQKAYEDLKGIEQFLTFEISDDLPAPKRIIECFTLLSDQIKNMKKEIEDWIGEVEFLEKNGFTLETIARVEELLLEVANQEFSEINSANVIETLEKNLNEKKREKSQLIQKCEEIKLKIEHFKKVADETKTKKMDIEQDLIRNQNQKNLMDQTFNVLSQLRESGIFIGDNDLFTEFYTSVFLLFEEVKELFDILQSNDHLTEKLKKKQQLKEKLNKFDNEQSQCKKAIKTLERVQPLGNYVQDFMNENISMINDIFLRLHTPQDFTSLELDEEEEIVAYRKYDKSERCTINQMSTGQRTALILSVFFVMHLSMETAPNILLLDEPVANMDDLNVLALIDFLRQFTLTRNTQIFFTTANPHVSNLFRRKFSILREQFKTYTISRTDGKQATLETKYYIPEREEGISV